MKPSRGSAAVLGVLALASVALSDGSARAQEARPAPPTAEEQYEQRLRESRGLDASLGTVRERRASGTRRSEILGIRLTEAEMQYVARQGRAADVVGQIDSEEEGRPDFGGAWFDPRTSTAYIATSAPMSDERRAAFERRFSGDAAQVAFVDVRHSKRYLLSLYQALSKDLQAWQRNNVEISSVRLDTPRNVVVVEVNSDLSRAASAFLAKYKPAPESLEVALVAKGQGTGNLENR